jgi:hypothetical protein
MPTSSTAGRGLKLCGAEIGENCEDAAVVIGVGRERSDDGQAVADAHF